jgi:hypothetical protein
MSFAASASSRSHREHLVHHPEDRVEGRLDRVAPVDRYIAMADLLQHLRVGHEALASGQRGLQQTLSVELVGMRRAHQVHRHIRVDQDHSGEGPAYPRSTSASISSMSAVGKLWRAAARTARSLPSSHCVIRRSG